MHKRVLISVVLGAWLAFWCGCGGQQAKGPDGENPTAKGTNGENPPAKGINGESPPAKGPDGENPPPKGTNGENPPANADAKGGNSDNPSAKGTADGGGNAAASSSGSSTGLDTSYIAADFAAAVVVRPKRAMDSKLVARLRGIAESLDSSGAPGGMPMDDDIAKSVEQFIGLAAPVEGVPPAPPVAGATITRFADAKAAAEMTGRIKSQGEKRTHGGKTYYVRAADVFEVERVEVPTEDAEEKIKELKGIYLGAEVESTKSADGKTTTVVVGFKRELAPGEMNAVFLPDEKTVVTSTEALLKKMMDAKDVKSPLVSALEKLGPDHDLAGVVLMDRLRPAIQAGKAAMGNQVSPMLAPLLASVDEMKTATIVADVDADPILKIAIESENEGAADLLQGQVTNLLQIGQGMYAGAAKSLLEEQPDLKPLVDIADAFVKGVSVKKDGLRVVAAAPALTGLEGLSEKLKPLIENGKQYERFSKLRWIVIAMQNHHDQFGMLPGNVAKDGKPLLSWRVAVLPFMDEQNLWAEFDGEQAWDSEHNKQLLDKVPSEFKSPFGEPKPGHTVYLMFQGPGTVLDGKQHTLTSILDGTSDTIAVIEVSPEKAVPWTKPVDIDFTAADLKQAIGPPPMKEGYPAAFFDGRVAIIPASTDMDTFKRLIRIDDGKPSGFTPKPLPYKPTFDPGMMFPLGFGGGIESERKELVIPPER